MLGAYRVAIKDGHVSVSPDLGGRTPGAEFEALFHGRERIDVISGPEDCEIGPLSEPTLEDVKAAKLADIAAARYEAETGGITVSGMAIQTDRESQGLITGAALAATIDPAYTCRRHSRSAGRAGSCAGVFRQGGGSGGGGKRRGDGGGGRSHRMGRVTRKRENKPPVTVGRLCGIILPD
jgi:hypothetical protein